MQITIHPTKPALGQAAAAAGEAAIRAAQDEYGSATIVVATGASQFEMLRHLTDSNIDWRSVTVFHLDEYVGLPASHRASFRCYLRERFIEPLARAPQFVAIEGDAADLDAEIRRLNGLLGGRRIDVCFAGIGENCHLAFNDPPADFDVDAPYVLVTLDEACRRQQLGEGWFDKLDSVPLNAISMSVRQIMRARSIILSVPDERKAQAVRAAVEGPVSPQHPASILQHHSSAHLFLDPNSASLLERRDRSRSYRRILVTGGVRRRPDDLV
jgi:glucosamine-6-phosphate deaminase